MSLPPLIRAVERDIIRKLDAEQLEVGFAITSYNEQTRAIQYNLFSRNPKAEVPRQAQLIVDRAFRELRDCQPNYLLYHRR